MREGWRRVRLEEVARLDVDRISVRPGDVYSIAGVWNAGQGLFARSKINASETSYQTLHRLRAGQLVMRKLTAWEGTITTVSPEFDGYFVSPEFPTYTLASELHPGFMRLICQHKEFWEGLRDLSTGTVQRRKRVNPRRLLEIEIDLPPLADQRRIVDLVAAVDHLSECEENAHRVAMGFRAALLADVLEPRDGWDLRTLADVAQVNPKEPPLPNDAPFAPMDAVEPGARWVKYFTARGERGGARARAGDTLFARITPCLENGKVAQVQSDVERCGGSTEFIVVRAGPALSPDFLYFWASAPETLERAETLMTGTTGRQRLAAGDLGALPMVVPPADEQRRITDLLTSLDTAITQNRRCRNAIAELHRVLIAELLSGDHEVPASYDRFLDGAA